MKILITGSKGFIGSNLLDFLSQKGYKVTGFDIKDLDPSFVEKAKQSMINAVLFKHYDLVIHLGANSSTTETNLNKILKQNFEFSKDLFEACEISKTRFQYASSASVYGQEQDFREDSFCKPLSPYAFSKYMFDCYLSLQNYPYQGFRYFNVFGFDSLKGDQASPVSKFLKQAKETGEIKLFEFDEPTYRDFVCVEDVCEMHQRFIERPDVSGVFNIGTGQPVTFNNVAYSIAKRTGATVKLVPFPSELKDQYQYYTCADLTKTREVIGDYKWTSVEEWLKNG